MITRKLLNEFASNAVKLGPAEAVHFMIGDWRFQSTPMMDSSAPSAYTDRAPLADDVSYAEFSDIFRNVLQGHPDQPTTYSGSNRTEAGLMALRVFDRDKHTSEWDIRGFSAIFEATTKAMISMKDARVPWVPVCVPWMREILETNMDIMPTQSFAQFIHEGSAFNSYYRGGNEQYLDTRIFSDDPSLQFHKITAMDQGLRALVNHCFDLKIGDAVNLSTAMQNESGILRLAKVVNELHGQGVSVHAYQKNLLLTAELLTLLHTAADKSSAPEAAQMHKAIGALVEMTMRPAKRVGKIRENRLRPRYTAERLTFWSVTESVESLATAIPKLCATFPVDHPVKGVQEALNRFRSQIGHDAYQALHNMTPHMANKKTEDYPRAYFKLAVNVSPEGVESQPSHTYLSKLDKKDLADLIGTLSSEKAKRSLMRQHPGVKGAVLMNDMGM